MKIGAVHYEAGVLTLDDVTGWSGGTAAQVEYLNRFYPAETSPVTPFGIEALTKVAVLLKGTYEVADAANDHESDPDRIC